MGVCVQQMVDADSAGVMFSRDPINGNPKHILITSNFGLGEVFIFKIMSCKSKFLQILNYFKNFCMQAVVSAQVDPDTIVVERSASNSISIKTFKIGKKLQKVSMQEDENGNYGTKFTNVLAEESSKLSLSQEIILKLAEIAVFLDQLYNAPRDIEWAVSQNQFYLLQCRPVTALDNWTDFELTHELGKF